MYQTANSMEIEKVLEINLEADLNLIQDGCFRLLVKRIVDMSPGITWWKRASMYHHPKDERYAWGNLKHVKRVVKIAYLLAVASELSIDDRDILIGACLLHDIGKYGIDGSCEMIQGNHAEVAIEIMVRCLSVGNEEETLEYREKFERPAIEQMGDIVLTHMGQWGNKKPETELQKLCHYADFMASRDDIAIPMPLDFKSLK